MTSAIPFRRFRAPLGVAAAAAIACAAAAVSADQARAFALINESPSLPRGLYLRHADASPTPGAIVATPQPSVARRYLGPLGMPPDVLLIKRVAAGPGDRVCRRGDRIHTPVRTVEVLNRDRRGAVLPRWDGCRTLGAHELFLLGDTAASFDSRYFGPVTATELEGVYREVITW